MGGSTLRSSTCRPISPRLSQFKGMSRAHASLAPTENGKHWCITAIGSGSGNVDIIFGIFGQFGTYFSALTPHTCRGMSILIYLLLGARAYWVLIGACNPML